MKQYTVHVCEICGYESRNYEYMRTHEANHFNLTVKEMDEYNSLKSFVRHLSSVVLNNNNVTTRQKYDESVEKLIAFEEEHNINITKKVDVNKFKVGDKVKNKYFTDEFGTGTITAINKHGAIVAWKNKFGEWQEEMVKTDLEIVGGDENGNSTL